jgi:MSHA pilin protein MshC
MLCLSFLRLDGLPLMNTILSSLPLSSVANDKKWACQRRHVSGFTLIEMIGVMVIMSILLFVATPRFFDRNAFDIRLFEDRIQSMLQYAQKTAIAQNRNVYVRLNGTSVALCLDSACTNKVAAPGGNNSGTAATKNQCGGSVNAFWMCEGTPAGVVYAATPATAGFFFNALGKPFNTAGEASLAAQLDISVAADGQARHMYIDPETGYVHP